MFMHTKTLHTTIHTHRQAHICIYTQVHRIFNWFRIDAVNHEGNMHTTKHTRTQAQTHPHAHKITYLHLLELVPDRRGQPRRDGKILTEVNGGAIVDMI